MNRSEQILQAARDLAKACFDARAARDARNACGCYSGGSSASDWGVPRDGDEAGTPCWKNWIQDSEHEDAHLPDRESWCASCLQREQHHHAYREAMQRRGRALRRIQAHYRSEVRA
jgi:hypothetical protein